MADAQLRPEPSSPKRGLEASNKRSLLRISVHAKKETNVNKNISKHIQRILVLLLISHFMTYQDQLNLIMCRKQLE